MSNTTPVSIDVFVQLKKDILWVYHENGGELKESYLPIHAFNLKYWEYLSMASSTEFRERIFYKKGIFVILISLIAADMDEGLVYFTSEKIEEIKKHVLPFKDSNPDVMHLKDILLLGLDIVPSAKDVDLAHLRFFEHKDAAKFYNELKWVESEIVMKFFENPYNY